MKLSLCNVYVGWVGILSWLGVDVNQLITETIEQAAQDIAQQLTQTYSVPQVFDE